MQIWNEYYVQWNSAGTLHVHYQSKPTKRKNNFTTIKHNYVWFLLPSAAIKVKRRAGSLTTARPPQNENFMWLRGLVMLLSSLCGVIKAFSLSHMKDRTQLEERTGMPAW